jgi:sarcosine oxidase, subunit alpha
MNEGLRTADGGSIDRAQVVHFRFDGRQYAGLAGDTLASALLANGVHLMGRSFKYHRPRGVIAAGAEEPNALVTVRRDGARETPNLRATQVELYEGLDAISQNRWPSLGCDVGAVNDLLAPFIPAGFYYKTFKWPKRAWHALYEPRIRAAAGLGRAPTQADPDTYATRHAHCDVLIVGAGPAGLAAAEAAATAGARVILCDEQSQMGGSLLSEPASPVARELPATLASLAANPRVTLLARTTAFGYFPHNSVALSERLTEHLPSPAAGAVRERQWQVRAREVVLATGAIERPLVFAGNDRPGIMLAGAARTYLNRYGVLPGARVVLVTACDEAYQAAFDLDAAGVYIACIADTRPENTLSAAARAAGIPVLNEATVLGTGGRLRVNSIELARVVDGQLSQRASQPCDLVLMSGGYTPSVHLHSQSRGKLTWSEPLQAFVPGASVERTRSAGACRGVFAREAVLADGNAQGSAAAVAALNPNRTSVDPGTGAPATAPAAPAPATGALAGALPRTARTRGRAFVDWQNDVTAKDLALALREGFRSIEHVKRYTTTGMATDQGKTSNLNALGIVSAALDRKIPEVGLTTFRMPYTPVTFGAFAGAARGNLFDPIRKTPTHGWAESQHAVFEDVGLWKRARYFPRGNEDMHAAVARECLAVRASCGIFDASTLGKIEVVGRDAATFMNRLYVNAWSNLAVGRCRYGILLRDDGFVYDDGVVARIGESRFHVTTTTGGAPRVLSMMEDFLQTEWPDLSVWLTSTTEQWAVVAVQGPRARELLAPLVDVDISAAAFPHMSVALGKFLGIPMRLFRVSFTGELGFEINVPADYGAAVWEAIWQAGQPYAMTAYGTESMHVLRAEKGYIIIGQDTDGTVTPDDAGLSWAIGKSKPDFVGKRSLARPAMQSAGRRQLVGLLTADPKTVLEEGSQVMAQSHAPVPTRPLGHVTSSYFSANLGRSIAMALVAGGRARSGQILYVPTSDGEAAVQVTSAVFYDPTGARINA